MITLTRLNGSVFVLNEAQIEYVDITPDTVISLNSGRKMTIKESSQELIDKIVQFKKQFSLPEVREKE